MSELQAVAFDSIAGKYDALWSDTAIGTAQRAAVWSRIDPLFKQGDLVLDAGCGTGVDALHLQSRGVKVHGIDSSARMVEVARSRGVDAHCRPIERLHEMDLELDGALSNFGALNCVESLASIAIPLGRMVRSGGRLALCVLSPVCLWEICFYLWQAKPDKAFRRLRGQADASIGARVFYPSSERIVSSFQDSFRLLNSYGIGLSVPPSYVNAVGSRGVEQLALLDRWLAHRPILRALADHRLYVFERI